ncbi:universal stress protein [Desulfovibrio inopinatus]|uniref:universal stress protein n=1 Tax=Desulfovibrio inopinatus TaxID=102109 RepID=UPI00040EEE10|nr:universal stress protein [Desulfovibrio inopinatus]
MECKKILIAVDGSENSLRAVRYVSDMLPHAGAVSIKLLYVERLPDRDFFPDEQKWKEECNELRKNVVKFMDTAKNLIVSTGISGENIETEYLYDCASPLLDGEQNRCSLGTSIAKEILNVVEKEGIGTVVVGRRGVSKAEEFLFGSVSSRIIHDAKYCTVWVVS